MASTLTRFRRPATAVVSTLLAGGLAAGLVSRLAIKDLRADSPVAAPPPPPKTFGSGPAFLSLPLESAEQVNHNTKRLRFRLPSEQAVSGLPLTSALLTFSWPKGAWTPVLRPYTPVSSADTPGFIDLLVKKYPNGKSSTHLHSLSPGDKLLFVAPLRGFAWKPNSYARVTLVAGGAGITPIYQLAQGILRNPADRTAVTLVFGVNSDADVLLRAEFDRLAREFPGRFQAVYTVSQPVVGSPYRKGYVTGELLREVAPRREGEETKVFVCGPPAMETALVGSRKAPGILEQLGYRKDEIHKF